MLITHAIIKTGEEVAHITTFPRSTETERAKKLSSVDRLEISSRVHDSSF